MKKNIAFILVVLIVMTAVMPVFAYVPCHCTSCKGRLSFQYGPWQSAYKTVTYENGRHVWRFYEVRTVIEKCSENSSHNCRYDQYRLKSTDYTN